MMSTLAFLSGDTVVVDDIDQYEYGEADDDGLLRLRGGVSSGLCPINDYIICVNGDNNGITCESACNGQCCTGSEACTGFTGKICRDGSSCKVMLVISLGGMDSSAMSKTRVMDSMLV